MNMQGPAPRHTIAQLVRAALEDDAKEIDVVRMQSQISERLDSEANAAVTKTRARGILSTLARSKVFRASLALAPVLMVIGFLGYLFVATTPVKAYALVQSAQRALKGSVDREYRVTVYDALPLPFLNNVDEIRLWTRGDRYRVQFRRGNKSILWGQDEKRRIWIATPTQTKLIFEASEIHPEIAALLSYLSLDIHRVTDKVLRKCDLSYADKVPPQDGIKTVHAAAKPNADQVEFSAAELDIEVTTKAIRNLQLTRRVNGKDAGRCQFTLMGETLLPDESYRLDSYLDAGDRVIGKGKYRERALGLFRVIKEFTKE